MRHQRMAVARRRPRNTPRAITLHISQRPSTRMSPPSLVQARGAHELSAAIDGWQLYLAHAVDHGLRLREQRPPGIDARELGPVSGVRARVHDRFGDHSQDFAAVPAHGRATRVARADAGLDAEVALPHFLDGPAQTNGAAARRPAPEAATKAD